MTDRIRFICALALTLAAGPTLFASEEAAAEPGWMPMIAKLINFALLAWIVKFAAGKFGVFEYLRDRPAQIRQGLADAAALRATAEGQLAGVQQRLATLPGELADMKRRGEEELASEKVRLAETTARERQRLLDQVRREIELQSRLARRALVEHGVELSMSLARTRIQKDITADDQNRLIDRYASGMGA